MNQPLTCDDILDRLTSVQRSHFSADPSADPAFANHLNICTECAALMETWQPVQELIRDGWLNRSYEAYDVDLEAVTGIAPHPCADPNRTQNSNSIEIAARRTIMAQIGQEPPHPAYPLVRDGASRAGSHPHRNWAFSLLVWNSLAVTFLLGLVATQSHGKRTEARSIPVDTVSTVRELRGILSESCLIGGNHDIGNPLFSAKDHCELCEIAHDMGQHCCANCHSGHQRRLDGSRLGTMLATCRICHR